MRDLDVTAIILFAMVLGSILAFVLVPIWLLGGACA